MKSSHLFILVCLLASLALVLSACGGSKDATTSNPGPSSSATTSATSGSGSINDILGKGANLGPVKFDMAITVGNQVISTATVYQKNKKMREETIISESKTIFFFDGDNNVMYTYLPDNGTALKALLRENMMPLGDTEDPSALLQYNPTVEGNETIDGKDCTIITYTVPGFGGYKIWIWNDKGFPLKIVGLTSHGDSIITYSNIDFSDIPDSTFEVPPEVKIIS